MLDSVGTTFGLSAVALSMWSYIKGFSSRLIGLFIVTITTQEHHVKCAFMNLMFSDFKKTPFGEIALFENSVFVNSLQKTQHVAFEMEPPNGTFFKGWRPIFISCPDVSVSNTASRASLSFIRGTFSAEKLITRAMDLHNANGGTTMTTKRFRVEKMHGTRGEINNTGLTGNSPSASNDHHAHDGYRPIGFERSDIGEQAKNDPMAGLFYDRIFDDLVRDIKFWLDSKDWCAARSIQWRIGAAFEGAPGTGKSSAVKAIGQLFDLPIFCLDLTTFSNKELANTWRDLRSKTPCIVLFEDMDRIFDDNFQIKNQTTGPQLTLDAILNCIQGVEDSSGIFTIATANNIKRIDPALGVPEASGKKSTRPGRFDHMVHFGPLNAEQRRQIAENIMSDCPDLIDTAIADGVGYTGAQFVKHCGDQALARLWVDRPKLISKPDPKIEKQRAYMADFIKRNVGG